MDCFFRRIVFSGLLPLSASLASATDQDNQAQVVVLKDVNLSQTFAGMAGSGVRTSDGTLYFVGEDTERGTEIWQMPSGSTSPSRGPDINPGPGSSNPSQLTVVGNHAIWVADDGTHGPEIRGSQMLPPGSPLVDLQPGAAHAAPVILGACNNWVWFTTGGWRNGRAITVLWAMTVFGQPLQAGEFEPGSVAQATALLGRPSLLFLARQPGSPTVMLFEAAEHVCEPLASLGQGTVPELAYAATSTFACFKETGGAFRLRMVDLNSRQVTTLAVQSSSTLPPWFATNGTDRVCFSGISSAGVEPWTVWREGGGTVQSALLADVRSGAQDSQPSRLMMSPGNPGVFFQVEEGAGRDLWFIDPQEKPAPVARKVKSAVHTGTHFAMMGAKEIAMALPTASSGIEIWLGDGPTGTAQSLSQNVGEVLKLWNPAPQVPQPRFLCVHARDGSTDQILTMTAFAQPWDPFYPLSELRFPSVALADFFFADDLYFSAANPGSEWRTLVRPTRGSPPTGWPLSVGSSATVAPSSMPVDFVEVEGALLFSAGVGTQRVLYASMDGQQDSAAQVTGVYHPEQPVVFQNRAYLLGHHSDNGTGLKRLFEVRKEGSSQMVAATYGGTPQLATGLVAAAGQLFFSKPVDEDEEHLMCLLAERTLAAPLTFGRDAGGKGITQMTGTASRLYFTAPHPEGIQNVHVVWCSDGTAAGTRKPSTLIKNPRLLGTVGDACVFWAATDDGEDYDLYWWDAGVAPDPVPCGHGSLEDAPERSSIAGRPAGVAVGGSFYHTTASGRVMRTDGTQLQTVFSRSGHLVPPDTLAVLGDKLAFLCVNSAGGGSLHTYQEAGGMAQLASFSQGLGACPLHVVNGRAYFTMMENGPRTALWRTDGTEAGTFRIKQDIALRATARLAMGSYSNHLVLGGEDAVPRCGLEPLLLNQPPVIPVPPLITGAMRGQPVSFTYAQIVAGLPTDADGDLTSALWLEAREGTLERNGSVVESASTPIAPGDTFVWTPPDRLSGESQALQLSVSDHWSLGTAPVAVRLDTPLDVWTRDHFTEEELAEGQLNRPDADADGDGVVNALEFVFGRHPRTHTNEPACVPTMADAPAGGGKVVRFTFARAAALTEGTVLTVESSPDLAADSWQAVTTKAQNGPWTGSATVTETSLPDGRVQVVVEMPAPATGQAFMRLSVTL